jgi:hypothetical protein
MQTDFETYARRVHNEHPGLFNMWVETDDPLKSAIGRAVLKAVSGGE